MAEILIVDQGATDLAAHVPGAIAFASDDEVGGEAVDCRILLADPRSAARLVDRLPSLRWIQSTWAGVDALARHGVREGVVVTGLKGVFGRQMAEFVFAHLLAHSQRVVQRSAARSWDPLPPVVLAGTRMGILGTGSIGMAVAATANHLGLEVVGCNRTGRPVDGVRQVFAVHERQAFARDLDHLVVVLPATAETDDLVDASMIDAMKPGATLINVGRGNSVVVADVVAALGVGSLSLAVLDVLPREPLPDGDPLWEVDGLIVTSHTAAWSRPGDVARVFLDNLRRFREGAPLLGVIDLDRGY
jgi:phosphoglycerate dehydrogenase-like enzyme